MEREPGYERVLEKIREHVTAHAGSNGLRFVHRPYISWDRVFCRIEGPAGIELSVVWDGKGVETAVSWGSIGVVTKEVAYLVGNALMVVSEMAASVEAIDWEREGG